VGLSIFIAQMKKNAQTNAEKPPCLRGAQGV
jgi:hypothetical protein